MISSDQALTLLATEALLLDERRWREWLDLYAEDAIFWVPARTASGELTADPMRQLSLIYYDRKESLRERIMRIESGRSLASTPLQRTVHVVGHAVALPEPGSFKSPFAVDVFEPRTHRIARFFGHYEVRLDEVDGALRIRSKKILLANDHLETIADIYSL